MTSQYTAQIVELTKRGFNPSQISEALNIDEETVLMVASQDSEAMEALSAGDVRFDDVQEAVRKQMCNLALYAESEIVRKSACAFVLETQLGMKKQKNVNVVNLNVVNILNERAEKAREMYSRNVKQITDVEIEQVA